MKKITKMILLFSFIFLLAGCEGMDLSLPSGISTEDISGITTVEDTTEITSDTSTSTTEEDALFKKLSSIYQLAVESEAFTGTYEEWLETVRGPQGEPGREVILQVSQGFVQWTYTGEDTWNNLLDLSSLVGQDGAAIELQLNDTHIQWKYTSDSEWNDLLSINTLIGNDGREVLFQVAEGNIQWQYVGDETWNNLIDLASLTGPQGEAGIDGEEVLLQVSDTHIQWKYTSDTEWQDLISLDLLVGAKGDAGVDGREVLFQVAEGNIQWQYVGDESWNNLIDLASLTGPQGEAGTDGDQVLLQVSESHIQWKYTSDTEWQDLISLDLLVGAKGDAGVDGREVLFQVNEGNIQWQYSGDEIWNNLVDLASLTGPQGEAGIDGDQVLLQVSESHIQWKYSSDTEWQDLISLDLLVGAKGDAGVDGREVLFQVAEGNIQWQYNGDETWNNLIDLASLTGPQGEAGKEVLFQVSEGQIQWQYTGDETWMTLISLETLTGPQGEAGKDVLFQVSDGYVQWQYSGEESWTNLIELSTITGNDGREISLQINEGYIQWQYVGEETWVDLIDINALTGTDGREVILQVSETHIQWQYVGEETWTNLIEIATLVGPKGDTGNGIESTAINMYGELVITYTDGTEVNLGVLIVLYTVNFYDGDGRLIDTQRVPYGTDVSAPSAPIKEGHTFDGWSTGFKNITSDLKVYPLYTADTFDVYFVENGGTQVEDLINVPYGSMIELPNLEKEGYDFKGWYYSDSIHSNQFYENTTIKKDITLYAKWDVAIHEVNFLDESDQIIKKVFVNHGGSALPPLYEKEGHHVIGYTEDLTYILSDLNVYPIYDVNTYLVFVEYYNDFIDDDLGFTQVEFDFNEMIDLSSLPDYLVDFELLNLYQVKIIDGIEVISPFTMDTMPANDLYILAELNEIPNLVLDSDLVKIRINDSFDPLDYVIAYDREDGDLNHLVTYSNTFDLSMDGTYIITYEISDQYGATSSIDLELIVVDTPYPLEASYPTGVYDYQNQTPDLRNTFMAAAEKYLLNNLYGGIPVYSIGRYQLFSSRLVLPVANYVPVLEYGLDYGSMIADDSTVLMANGLYGNSGEYTLRKSHFNNPVTYNQWMYATSQDADYMSLYMDSPYKIIFNDDKTSYQIVPSMMMNDPLPINSWMTDSGKEVSKIWQFDVRQDLEWFFHPNTDTSQITDTRIDASDFVDTYKLALMHQWMRAITGGNDFINGTLAIANAQTYVDNPSEENWHQVGIRLIDQYTFELEFVDAKSEWDVKYNMTSFALTPIHTELFELLSMDVYGTSPSTIAYHGAYYVDNFEYYQFVSMKKNPNYHSPNQYFYTGYEFNILANASLMMDAFVGGQLDVVNLPSEDYDAYKDHPRLKEIPGTTTFRLMINGLGSVENQQSQFENSSYVPEPILANENFKKAMYHVIDREYLAKSILKTYDPQMYYFTSAYLVDSDQGISYRSTPQGQLVGQDLFEETYGYNLEAATAYWHLAIDEMVEAGFYQEGDIIEIEFFHFMGNESNTLTANYLETVFESTFIDEGYNISVDLIPSAKSFPQIYYDFMMTGDFDLAIGGISGSLLDAPSFLGVFADDNRSGFTLNWGIDTSTANIPVLYETHEYDEHGNIIATEYHHELWSFNAIESILNGQTYIDQGQEAPYPILADADFDYYMINNVHDWEQSFEDPTIQLNPTSVDDPVLQDISHLIKDASFLYTQEVEFSPQSSGSSIMYRIDGQDVYFDMNLSFRLAKANEVDGILNLLWSGPTPQSGQVYNLTPNTIFMPEYIDLSSPDYDPNKETGHWFSYPVVYQPGRYQMIFAEIDGEIWIGAIYLGETSLYPDQPIYPTGWYDYKHQTTDVRHTFMAAAEKYLMNNMYGGVPLYANGQYNIYSERLQLPVDNYISVMGYGTKFGTMTADDSTVLMADGQYGNIGEYTYRTASTTNPVTWNQWLYDTSTDSDYMSHYMDAPYTYQFNVDKTGYVLSPSMMADDPNPVNSRITETGKEVATKWRFDIRQDLQWFFHPDTDTSYITDTTIDAEDFVETYKLALANNWFRAVGGGADFLYSNNAILGAQEFADHPTEENWANVGIKWIDEFTFEFEFLNEQSEWDVKYFMSTFIMTPIHLEMYQTLGDVNQGGTYGTSHTSIAYHGAYYMSEYSLENTVHFKENPNYHTLDEYFYTGYEYQIINDPAIRFQEFVAGKLDSVILPTENYDEYKNHPGLKHIPGATTFRMMINGLGTLAAQQEQFPGSTYVPEPILANDNFKMAMFFAIDRQYLAETVLKTSKSQMYLFSDAYLVDPETGIPYRQTPQGLSVGEGLSPETNGYNLDTALAYWELAIEELVNQGIYFQGDVIELDFFIFSGSEVYLLLGQYIKTTFENTFIHEGLDISVIINVVPKDFPNIYFDFMMTGEFDLSIGGISGSTLDAASFLDVFADDNRGGFTLNWGIDTSSANIPVKYVTHDYDSQGNIIETYYRYEMWSFNAISSVLNGGVELIEGVEAPEPDFEPPIISGANNLTIELGTEYNPLDGVSAYDNIDGNIILDHTNYVSNVDVNTPGDYLVTYTASDSAGNITSVEIIVTVIDTNNNTNLPSSETWITYGNFSLDYIVTYGTVPSNWWDSRLEGSFEGFDPLLTTFDVTLVGEAGQNYILRLESLSTVFEHSFEASGFEQVISFDLSGMTEEERAGLNLLVVYAQSEGTSGTLVIKSIDGIDISWMAYGDMSLSLDVTYGPISADWWNDYLQSFIIGFDQTQTHVQFNFIGEAGQSYKFKLEGSEISIEHTFLATGSEQTEVIDISAFTQEQRASLEWIVLFATSEGISGKFTLLNWGYQEEMNMSDLFISEYGEGSSNNKWIEIYNGTNQTVDLTPYTVSLYSNGATTPSYSLDLTGFLAAGEVLVIYNSSASTSVTDHGDITSEITYFNGDDAVALLKDEVVIDVVGIIGEDPGSFWLVGDGTTQDHTLVRKDTVTGPTNVWSPSEWDVYSQDTFDYLGHHVNN